MEKTTSISILVLGALLAAGCAASKPRQVQTEYAVPKHMPAAVPVEASSEVADAECAEPVEAAAAGDNLVAQAAPAPAADAPKVNKPARKGDVPKEYLHFTTARVRAGQTAPDFELPLADGAGSVALSSLRDRPTVLVFGSLTCDRFRASAPEVVKLHKDFGHSVNFLFVYVREAHASDEWVRQVNEYVGIQIPQPTDLDQRSGVARTCVNRLKLPFTTVVDGMDDAVSVTWGAWPERLYIIDTDGKIAYQGGVGPAGFLPSEVRSILTRDFQLTARLAN